LIHTQKTRVLKTLIIWLLASQNFSNSLFHPASFEKGIKDSNKRKRKVELRELNFRLVFLPTFVGKRKNEGEKHKNEK